MAAHCMQGLLPERATALARPSRSVTRRCRVVASAQVKTIERPETTTTTTSSTAEADIYIGKGRFIKGDPKKFPGRENLGVFTGATGGWAGGETALWELRTELQASKPAKAVVEVTKPTVPAVTEKDKAPIYIGKAKEGGQPRYIVDDPRKYPGRENLGAFTGATGGFAGGEKGLKQFVETGEIELRPASLPSTSQYSPLTIAGLLVAAGVGGGLLLDTALLTGKELVAEEVEQVTGAPVDENTKVLLLLALGLLGTAGAVGAARAAIGSLQQRVREGAQQALTVASFWVGLLLVTSVVLSG